MDYRMTLMKLSDSAYLSNYATPDGGKAILEKIKSTDFSKYELDQDTVKFLAGTIDRKITDGSKSKVLNALSNGSIRLITVDVSFRLPSYLIVFPMVVSGSLIMYLNITAYAKIVDKKVEDIDPRVLYAMLLFAMTQLKVYKNPKIIEDIELCDNVHKSFKKIISKVINKIVNINILTPDERIRFEILTSLYISIVLLRKSKHEAKNYITSLYKKTSLSQDRLETELNSIDLDNETFESLKDYIDILKNSCASFNKLSLALLLKEYAISMKNQAILSVDIVQIYVAVIVAVEFGSFGIFNDSFLVGTLDQNELKKINNTVSKY